MPSAGKLRRISELSSTTASWWIRLLKKSESKDIMNRVEEGGTIAGKGAEGDVRGSFSKYADLTERAIHVQKQIIRKLAEKEACVIIGRSADYILKDSKDIKLLRAFIYAPDEIRIQNIMKSHSLSESDAKFYCSRRTNGITSVIWR